MTTPQAVIRDRQGTVHRIACLHRHAHSPDPMTVECSVWEVMTGTEADFDLQILLDAEARKTWTRHNPDLPFCPGAELPEPAGARRFGGAIGVVEAVLHSTDLKRSSRVIVDSGGGVSVVEGAKSVALRGPDGTPVSIELALPPGSQAIR